MENASLWTWGGFRQTGRKCAWAALLLFVVGLGCFVAGQVASFQFHESERVLTLAEQDRRASVIDPLIMVIYYSGLLFVFASVVASATCLYRSLTRHLKGLYVASVTLVFAVATLLLLFFGVQ